jgi:hypothetical protein
LLFIIHLFFIHLSTHCFQYCRIFLKHNVIGRFKAGFLLFQLLLRTVFVAVKIFSGNRLPLEIAVPFTVYFKLGIILVDAYATEILSQELDVFLFGYLDIFRACSAPFNGPGIMSAPCAFIGSKIHGVLNKAA